MIRRAEGKVKPCAKKNTRKTVGTVSRRKSMRLVEIGDKKKAAARTRAAAKNALSECENTGGIPLNHVKGDCGR